MTVGRSTSGNIWSKMKKTWLIFTHLKFRVAIARHNFLLICLIIPFLWCIVGLHVCFIDSLIHDYVVWQNNNCQKRVSELYYCIPFYYFILVISKWSIPINSCVLISICIGTCVSFGRFPFLCLELNWYPTCDVRIYFMMKLTQISFYTEPANVVSIHFLQMLFNLKYPFFYGTSAGRSL